ncbi:VOC family protein [Dyadobacter sediminis]|uniref:VOC family protein n=1 Tax=Dyadobacter sediminis TaxID=1493691 RepID=A0A5R9KKC3_9BACT|nr:VOC family protein [Dyadobacter sediminis]TLU96670.1 VOC family protein [Dyadobacter sediminis]GGB84195.1 VOC family protein [Dyadobacter sediminis]
MTQGTTKLNPYLFFGGNCRQAMEFYQDVFGGELTFSTYGEGPADAHQDPKANSNEMKDKIMYSKLNGDFVILASDSPYSTPGSGTSQFSLSLEGSNESLLTGYFKKLSENGHVNAPLVKQFWGDFFGMLTDPFGVNWMISITSAAS